MHMFEVKQVIEGKIFIHHRCDEMLTVFHRYELPAQYFECFINAQNFTGHFVEIHAQPADEVRVVYIQKNDQNKIIAMLNHTQQVLHLYPQAVIFSRWSWMHRVIPNLIKIIIISDRHSILNVLSMLKILPDILSKYMLNLLMKSVLFTYRKMTKIKS